MGKSKRGRSLYEVIDKAKLRGGFSSAGERLEIPAPAADDEAEPLFREPTPAPPAREPPPCEPEEIRADEAAPRVREPDAEAPESEPAIETESGGVRIDGGVIRITLTSTRAAVALFGVVVLLAVTAWIGYGVGHSAGQQEGFVAGRQSLEAEVADDIQTARMQPVTEGLFDQIGPSPLVPAGGGEEAQPAAARAAGGETGKPTPVAAAPTSLDSAEPGGWIKGHTYVCVQEFEPGALGDARRAQEFLRQNRIETALVNRAGTRNYWLVTRQGFDCNDPSQKQLAEDYRERIRQLGERYFRSGGRYRLEGYLAKLTRDTW
jgi:hypothetical protein